MSCIDKAIYKKEQEMAFKKPLSESGIRKGDDFIESADENLDSTNIKKGNELKMVSVKLPQQLIERVKSYQKSDMARRVDTQGYIFEQAITKWLDEKGFDK